jgi:hypothetical protein
MLVKSLIRWVISNIGTGFIKWYDIINWREEMFLKISLTPTSLKGDGIKTYLTQIKVRLFRADLGEARLQLMD